MKINGTPYRTIWQDEDGTVQVIDQRWLPHDLRIVPLRNRTEFATAIRDMWVRGAPLIGATAAWGMAVQMAEDPSDSSLFETWEILHETRPTAINLRWALDTMREVLEPIPPFARAAVARAPRATDLRRRRRDQPPDRSSRTGHHPRDRGRKPGKPVSILTHCNAGWLATVDWGTATSPIYHADAAGIPVHVFVDETRPRNQGAQLTAWELQSHGISHDLIVDNAGGHLMQHGEVDMVIVGTDRTTARGDVCNKIGTYLKALAAHANRVPFYVALPSPTIDWRVHDGVRDIPIEERSGAEVTKVQGRDADGRIVWVQISPDGTRARNPAFDVTPAELVTGLLTERGLCPATAEGLATMFSDLKGAFQT